MNLKNQVTNSVSSVYLFVLTLVTAGRGALSAHDVCGEQNVLGCAQSFSKLSDKEEMRLLRTKADLDRICPELLKSVECVDRYSRLCMDHAQRAHFHHLYSGIAKVVQDLCQDGDYREEFLKHAPCMSEVTEEHEVCSRIHLQKIAEMQGRSATRHARHSHHENEHSDQPHHHDEYPHHNVHHRQHHHHHRDMPNATEIEEAARVEEIKTVCCTFHDYLRCSHRGVAAKCGEETGSFANDFMTQMASKVIKIHCKDYPAQSAHCMDASAGALAPKTTLFSGAAALSSLVLAYNALRS